ncbi:hypothetical protein [Sporocytophaga myxococcoides]|uniref:hypothetical protein n=1 Tax=Sporocytophaga myxococcoides TaxID=153721 RepID=UPI00048CDEF6|nr:hypothetical protein [Sporocytophaga myxococcoides]
MLPKKNNTVKRLNIIMPVCAIAAFTLFTYGLKNIDKYTHWISLSFTIVTAAFLFATILYFVLDYYISGLDSYKNVKNVGFYPQLVVLTIFSFFGLGQIVNEAAPVSRSCKSYPIVRKMIRGSRHKDYRVIILGKGGLEELSYGKSFYDHHKEGDRIDLCLAKGMLGYEYYVYGGK